MFNKGYSRLKRILENTAREERLQGCRSQVADRDRRVEDAFSLSLSLDLKGLYRIVPAADCYKLVAARGIDIIH